MRALWHLRAVIFFLQAKLNVMPGIGSGEEKKKGGEKERCEKTATERGTRKKC